MAKFACTNKMRHSIFQQGEGCFAAISAAVEAVRDPIVSDPRSELKNSYHPIIFF